MDHYLVFETTGGFSGIAWNDVGVTRFRFALAQSTAETERNLLRRLPGAEPGTPTPKLPGLSRRQSVISRARRSTSPIFRSTLENRTLSSPSSTRPCRRVGWGQTTTYGAVAKDLGAEPQAARDVGQAMAKTGCL